LSKSHFQKSYGYNERSSFAFTKGLIHAAYVSATQSDLQLLRVDVIRTTDPSPDHEILLGAVEPGERENIEIFQSSAWCAFRDSEICWHSYYAFKELPEHLE